MAVSCSIDQMTPVLSAISHLMKSFLSKDFVNLAKLNPLLNAAFSFGWWGGSYGEIVVTR